MLIAAKSGQRKPGVFRNVSEQVSEDENAGPDLSNVAVCLHDGYLMVATDVALLEHILTKGPKVGPLATDRRYARVLRRIDEGSNEDTILRQFSDHGVDLGALYGFAARARFKTSPLCEDKWLRPSLLLWDLPRRGPRTQRTRTQRPRTQRT